MSRRAVGARAEQASQTRALALMATPLLAFLVVATVVFGSSVTMASPRSQSLASVGNYQSDDGLSHALGSLGAPQSSRTTARYPRGSNQITNTTETVSVMQTRAIVAQAISPSPFAEINPITEPSTSTVVAAASLTAAAAAASPKSRGTITIETFGYSFGGPSSGSKFVADVRNIEAGSFAQSETGLMPSVRDRVMATGAAQEWLRVFRTEWMPSLKDGDMVSIGCARGHHRSVTLGVLFAEDLKARGYTVNLVHRDILRTW